MMFEAGQLCRVLVTKARVATVASSRPPSSLSRYNVSSNVTAVPRLYSSSRRVVSTLAAIDGAKADLGASSTGLATIAEHLKLFNLIKAYESEGHLIANLDPLQNAQLDPRRAPFVLEQVEILRKEYYGFKESDLDKVFFIGDQLPTIGPECTLKHVLRKLRKAYCGSVGIEFTHIIDRERRHWISDQVWQMSARQDLYNELTIARLRRIAKEGCSPPPPPPSTSQTSTSSDTADTVITPYLDSVKHQQNSSGQADEVGKVSRAEQLRTLELLARTVRFENFCSRRFSGAKRFGIEGCEALVPGLVALLDRAAFNGVQCVEMGMAHRGR
jgi:2-oxoglutarate dehydrogenase complex dehydrogenase (E1) component-like enzyme